VSFLQIALDCVSSDLQTITAAKCFLYQLAGGDVREFPADVLPDLMHPCFDLLTKPFSSIVALHVLNFNDMARYFSSGSYHFSPLE
jgi:hypothetical protein